jgi:hypothetical protein
MNTEVVRRFKGIWIPKEIWLHPQLTPMQKLLIAEVDSLSTDESPCFANDEYFAQFFSVSVHRVQNLLSELRALKVLESCGVDSQKRRLLRVKATLKKEETPFPKSGNPFPKSGNDDSRNPGTPIYRIDKSIEKNDIHDAKALWMQSFQTETGSVYAQGNGKRQKADDSAIQSLLNDGFTPASIGQLATKMFKAVKTANGEAKKTFFWSSSVRTIETFVTRINEIQGELSNAGKKPGGAASSNYARRVEVNRNDGTLNDPNDYANIHVWPPRPEIENATV